MYDCIGRYEGDVSKLVDAVRCSIVVDTEEQLVSIASALDKKGIIVRSKNRFKHPLWNGYRDALYNVEIDEHICEVQLHLGAILAHTENTHRYYAYFRTFFSGNTAACQSRIALLEKIIDPHSNNLTLPNQAITSLKASFHKPHTTLEIEQSLMASIHST